MKYLFKIAQLVLQENKSAEELLEIGYPQGEIEYVFRLVDLLKQNGYKCNADARAQIAQEMPSPGIRKLDPAEWERTVRDSLSVGGCEDGVIYYSNAQGFISEAHSLYLYDLPEEMVNPYLFCFSGMMTAHLYAFEVIRFYAKQYHKLLPLVCIGKGGNKGLFDKVFNREHGLMAGTEYQAYLNCLCQLAPEDYVRENERVCRDMDTVGNFDEIYLTAKSEGLSEITAVLCTDVALPGRKIPGCQNQPGVGSLSDETRPQCPRRAFVRNFAGLHRRQSGADDQGYYIFQWGNSIRQARKV